MNCINTLVIIYMKNKIKLLFLYIFEHDLYNLHIKHMKNKKELEKSKIRIKKHLLRLIKLTHNSLIWKLDAFNQFYFPELCTPYQINEIITEKAKYIEELNNLS